MVKCQLFMWHCSAETPSLPVREGAQHYCGNLYGPLQGGGVDLCKGRPPNVWNRGGGEVLACARNSMLLCPIILCHHQTALGLLPKWHGMCSKVYLPYPLQMSPPNSPRVTSTMMHLCSRPKLYAHRITSSTQQWTLWNGFKSSSKQMQARKQNIIWFRDTFDKFVKHQTVFLFVSELCGNLSIFKLWFVIGVFAQKWEPGQ